MFHRMTLSVTPAWTNFLLSFGRPRPITFTSLRPACLTASAAPGTAGEQIAMISFTPGWAFMTVVASSNAFCCLSSHGRTATSFMSGVLRGLPRPRCACSHSFWFAAVSDAVMTANSPFPPSTRAASSISLWPIPSGVAWLTNRSRASGSASASQVTTLIPFARALRSTVESPSRFSTATAITSTPRVIHASTTSACFAGSVSVGPSHSSSTPSSRAASSAPRRHAMK